MRRKTLMHLLRRHKSVLTALGIYWPAIFWLTHIPVPEIARRSGMSDKTMHVLAYFVLTFLIWFAVSPYDKIRWDKLKTWIVIAIITVYAALDECLQGMIMGRSSDIIDFLSDILGMAAGVVVLMLFDFWPAMLTASAVFIFVVSTMSNLPHIYPKYHLDSIFHFTAYAAFTFIWIQHQRRSVFFRRFNMLFALIIPVFLLLAVITAARFWGRSISSAGIFAAIAGICLVLFSAGAACLIKSRLKKNANKDFQ